MIPLNTIRVAAPCTADWEQMEGDDQARFCTTCRKNVYNLSAMTEAGAQALVNRHEGKLCVRFYTRTDGTLLTQDCPVGLRAVRRKLVRKLSYAAALLLSGVLGLLSGASAVQVPKKPADAGKPTHMRGKAALPKPKSTNPRTVVVRKLMAPPTVTMGVPRAIMGKPIAPKLPKQ
jgi:hypothetical protein